MPAVSSGLTGSLSDFICWKILGLGLIGTFKLKTKTWTKAKKE